VRIGKLLDALEAVMALLALVFVKWHGLPETLPNRQARLKVSLKLPNRTENWELTTATLILGFVPGLVNEPAVVCTNMSDVRLAS
jgi:hypothetical protein